MANFNKSRIYDVHSSDVEACLLLSDEANWNQVADDWHLFLRQGKVIGYRDDEGRLIATAAALPYDSELGYISMVLVTEKWRRRGLATHLVDFCIYWLQQNQRVPVLDATAAGAEVYRHQGFYPLFELQRWQTNAAPLADDRQAFSSRKTVPGEMQTLVRLDGETVGGERAFLIRDFIARKNVQVFVTEKSDGFIMIRPGRRAFQIGPLIARSQKDAIDLISHAFSFTKDAIFVDVPAKSVQVIAYLACSGFTKQRSFMRMVLGREQPFGMPERLNASAGPEFG